MNGAIRMSVPRFGGEDVRIKATDSKLWIDGAHDAMLVMPVGAIFSNAASDNLHHQVVLETSIITNYRLGIIASLTKRTNLLGDDVTTRDVAPKRLFQCTMEIAGDKLVVHVGENTAEFPLK